VVKKGGAPKANAEEETDIPTTRQIQDTSKPNETDTAAVNKPRAVGFSAINAPEPRKSRRLKAANESPSDSNPTAIIQVPRPRVKFIPKTRSENLGIAMADLGNYNTAASQVLGHGGIEDVDFLGGAASGRNLQIPTRAVARKTGNEWRLEFGPGTEFVCEREGEVVVFDDLKLAMNPASEQFKLQLEKEKKVGHSNIYLKYIEWLFSTIFNAAKLADPNIERFLVYTGLPPGWPENVSDKYKTTIQNIPGWEEKVDVDINSEPTMALNGRLKSLTVEQRKAHKVYLEDSEYGGILDVGDATGVR
jgi:hypothetical protein